MYVPGISDDCAGRCVTCPPFLCKSALPCASTPDAMCSACKAVWNRIGCFLYGARSLYFLRESGTLTGLNPSVLLPVNNDANDMLLHVIMLVAFVSAFSWGAIGLPMRMARNASVRFAAANALVAVGGFLVQKRTLDPSFVNYQLGDWLVFCSYALFFSGAELLGGLVPKTPLARWLPLGLAIGATSFVSPDHSSFVYRMTVASAVMAWYFMLTFLTCLRGLATASFPFLARVAISWPFLVAGLVAVARGASTLIQAQAGVRAPMEAELNQGPFLWVMVLLILMANISLTGLVVGRLVIRIRALAERDHLTGCWNRRSLESRLALEMVRKHRSGEHLGCILFDLDHFKRLNDGYGHAAGDAALKHAVAVAQSCIRSIDALGRYGGEEFVVIMPGTHLTGAREVATRIREALEANPLRHDKHVIDITASFGATALAETDTKDSLLRRADSAMYEAKRRGRNRVEVYAAEDFTDQLLKDFRASMPLFSSK